METPVIPTLDESTEVNRWEEEELDILAFELWQQANCPDETIDDECVDVEPWCHASCL